MKNEKVYVFVGKGAGIPGLPHQVTKKEAENRKVGKLLDIVIERGTYVEKKIAIKKGLYVEEIEEAQEAVDQDEPVGKEQELDKPDEKELGRVEPVEKPTKE